MLLRELTQADVAAVHAVLGDAETMSFYPHAFSIDETKKWIQWNLDGYQEHGHGLWALVLRETGELVGDCGLTIQHVDGDDMVEVGWHVRRDLWGRGLATEAAIACRDYGFESLELPFLISLVRPENIASCRVAEKIGMQVSDHTMRGPNEMWRHCIYRVDREGSARPTSAE